MAILKIITKGHPTLRKKAAEVLKFDQDLAKLAKDMARTMETSDGIGLAANQVNVLKRIITLKVKNDFLVMVNPKIRKKSIFKNTGEEGCLSVPGVFGLVKRYNALTIIYFDLKGEARTLQAKGLLARVIQHEIDHLDGILFTDKVIKYTHGENLTEL